MVTESCGLNGASIVKPETNIKHSCRQRKRVEDDQKSGMYDKRASSMNEMRKAERKEDKRAASTVEGSDDATAAAKLTIELNDDDEDDDDTK